MSALDALAGRPRWQTRAACRGVDPDLFFPQRGDMTGVEAAKAVCADCPVRAECLDYSVALPQSHAWGIWGGKSERERRRLRRQSAAAAQASTAA